MLTGCVSSPERSVGHTTVDTLSSILGFLSLGCRLGKAVWETLREVWRHGQGCGRAGAGVLGGGRGGGSVPTIGSIASSSGRAGVVVVVVLREVSAVEPLLDGRGGGGCGEVLLRLQHQWWTDGGELL